MLVIPPGGTRPFNPLKQQWVFPFRVILLQLPKLHSMAGPHARGAI